jgi:hypothetical protein
MTERLFRKAADWRAWLEKNHDRGSSPISQFPRVKGTEAALEWIEKEPSVNKGFGIHRREADWDTSVGPKAWSHAPAHFRIACFRPCHE